MPSKSPLPPTRTTSPTADTGVEVPPVKQWAAVRRLRYDSIAPADDVQ